MRVSSPPTAFAAFAASVWAFALVGAGELCLFGLAGVLAPVEWGGVVVLGGHLLALNVMAGAVIGLAMALVVPPLVGTTHPWRWLKAYVFKPEAAGTAPEALNRAAAWGLATLVALVPIGLVAFLGGRIAHGFNQERLAGGFIALMAMVGIAVGIASVFPARAAVVWILDRLAPSGRFRLGRDRPMKFVLPTPALPLLLMGIGGVVAAAAIGSLDLGAYQLGGLLFTGLGATVALVLLIAGRGRGLLQPRVAGLSAMLAFTGLAGWTVVGLEDTPRAARLIAQNEFSSGLALKGFRRLLDGDGDGYALLLAGGDCDDTDPNVGPHAKEIPANGIDDNCQGGDAPAVVEAPPTPPPLPAAAAKPKPRWNIVFLLIDTLRPDHLGLYGYGRNTSPVLDAWAKSAVVFEHVYAQAPNTPRSMPSILTGRYPSRVAWTKRYANYAGLAPENETLFEVFGAAGWRTEAVTAHWYFEKAKGIKDGVDRWDNRGFTTIRKSNTQSAAPETTPRVVARLEALAGGEAPFVLFAHYFEPHGKYLNHPDVRVFGKKGLKNKYDSEIAFVDHHLQPVFDALARPELADETVVVVTSDHGEAFGEHGFHFHGRTLYEEESRVPLIIRVPGVSPRRVAHPVALVDLLPTLAALTGQRAPKALGQSLAPVLGAGGELAPVPIFIENLPYPNYKKHIVAMMDPASRLKVVRNITDNVSEVFDLEADPGERRNLLDASPAAGKAQRDTLNAFIDADPG